MNTQEMLVDNIQFQFSISKQMLSYHLDTLDQEEYMFKSEKNGLCIQEKDGTFYADFPETESYSMGTPTVAWTLWHICYWWELVFNNAFGDGTFKKEDIIVYNDVSKVRNKIYSLCEEWEIKLNQLQLEDYQDKKYTKFPFNNEVEFHKLASWLNLELMKNASEIGYARFDYAKR